MSINRCSPKTNENKIKKESKLVPVKMCCVMVREKMSWEANLRSFLPSQQSLDWSQLLSHARPWEREQTHGVKELNTRGWTVEAKNFSGTRRLIKSWKKCLVGLCTTGTDTTALTFLCSVTYDDLSASFAGLLHRERCAEALLVLPQALAFFETVLLHDLVGHRTTAWGGGWEESSELVYIVLLKV